MPAGFDRQSGSLERNKFSRMLRAKGSFQETEQRNQCGRPSTAAPIKYPDVLNGCVFPGRQF